MMMKDVCLIRTMNAADLSAVNDIYNFYVVNSTCTYQEQAESLAARTQWFQHHGTSHPLIVAEANQQVIGWGSLSPYHSRSAYRRTVENSVYVHHQQQRRGIGSLLLGELIQRSRVLGHHAIIAGIDAEQSGSIALHAQFGFEHAGRLRQVGFKFNRWLDVIYMQLLLGDG